MPQVGDGIVRDDGGGSMGAGFFLAKSRRKIALNSNLKLQISNIFDGCLWGIPSTLGTGRVIVVEDFFQLLAGESADGSGGSGGAFELLLDDGKKRL